MACLVFVQAMAVGIASTLGPAHSHPPASRPLVLEDLRRTPSRLEHRPTHVLTGLGHFHRFDASQRHYHARDDGSVTLAHDGSAQLADESDGAATPALTLLALLPALSVALAGGDRSAPVARAAWPLITDDPRPLERPPRPG
jgi:hypothetical protein